MVNSPGPDRTHSSPLVTVMMPAYNCERYVGEAIESIINQTYTNWELICVDDGSTDGTLQIMQEYAAKDARIRVFANSQNRGRPWTRNRIIQLAQGEILAVQDADDISLPHRLEEGVQMLTSHPQIAIVGASIIETDQKGEQILEIRATLFDHSLEEIFAAYQLPFAGPAAIMRASAVRMVGGYDEFFLLAEDYDLFLRMAIQGYRFEVVPRPWYLHRLHSERGTTTQAITTRLYQALAHSRAQALARRQPFDLEAEFNRLNAKAALTPEKDEARGLYVLGKRYIQGGKVVAARQYFRQALRGSPLFPRALLGYMLTFVPTIIRQPLIRAYSRIARKQAHNSMTQ